MSNSAVLVTPELDPGNVGASVEPPSPELQQWLFEQFAQVVPASDLESLNGPLKAAPKMSTELKPRNALEAMLLTEMLAVHTLQMECLKRAIQPGQTPLGAIEQINCATKLARVYLDQVAAFERMRGRGGQQRVTVKHVHLHDQAQAVVGALTSVPPAKEEKGK